MAISLTVVSQDNLFGQTFVYGTFDLDNSYPAGGYPILRSALKLNKEITYFIPLGNQLGYMYQWNEATSNLEVLTANTVTAINSVVSVTAGTGVSAALSSIPVANVNNVYITAGDVTGAAVIVPSGSVANSKEVSINYTTGVLQFLVADAVTSATVTYQPRKVGQGTVMPTGANLSGVVNCRFIAMGQ